MKNSLDTLQEWLEKAINYERLSKVKFSLQSMENLVAKFDNPQNSFKSVHVAGSKGKGSVSQFIASILSAAGISEGLYTSPHIMDFSERVRAADAPLSEAVYQKAAAELMDKADTASATWFELVTLFSFLCFKDAGIDWAVFETGMGGRLDATNVILPQLCVITPIELEHTEILGDSIAKIAAEKAGIFKKNIPVCVAPQTEEARKVFTQKAAELDCQIFFLEDLLRYSSYSIHKDGMDIFLDFAAASDGRQIFRRSLQTRLQMTGSVQVQNAALAALACKILFPEIDEKIIESGLKTSKLSGRFEILHIVYQNLYNLRIILDGAHTVNSIQYVVDTIKQTESGKKLHLLFGCASDKKVAEIAPLFFRQDLSISRITLTPPGAVKKANLPAIKEAFEKRPAGIELAVYENYKNAVADALKKAAENGASLLVTGSFYLLGEVYKIIQSQNQDK